MFISNKCCTLPCYLDNRSAVGVMVHNTSDSRFWYFHNKTRSGGYLSHG